MLGDSSATARRAFSGSDNFSNARRDSLFYGVYIFGDYETRRIFGLTQENGRLKEIRQIGTSPQRIVSFGRDGSGELYVVGYEGTIYRIDFEHSHFD